MAPQGKQTPPTGESGQKLKVEKGKGGSCTCSFLCPGRGPRVAHGVWTSEYMAHGPRDPGPAE